MKALSSILSAFALALPLTTFATGAFEINQDCAAAGCFAGDAAGFPVTITQPGSYVLTSDLVVNSGSDGIDVLANQVDLDLNGHTLDGGGSCTGTPVSACAGAIGITGIDIAATSASAHIRVHNGTVRGFGNTGIYGGDAGAGAMLEHLTVTENAGQGIWFSVNAYSGTVRVRDSMIVRNTSAGLVGLPNLVVDNCVFSGNQSSGLRALGESTIANSRFEHNGSYGVWSSSAGSTNALALDHNLFRANNGSSSSQQYASAAGLLDMGGNVCDHMPCP